MTAAHLLADGDALLGRILPALKLAPCLVHLQLGRRWVWTERAEAHVGKRMRHTICKAFRGNGLDSAVHEHLHVRREGAAEPGIITPAEKRMRVCFACKRQARSHLPLGAFERRKDDGATHRIAALKVAVHQGHACSGAQQPTHEHGLAGKLGRTREHSGDIDRVEPQRARRQHSRLEWTTVVDEAFRPKVLERLVG